MNRIADNSKNVNKKTKMVTNTGEILEDRNARGKDRNWAMKKKKSVRMHDIAVRAVEIRRNETGEDLLSANVLDNMQHCGDALIFSYYADGSKKLTGANFCKSRICPMCCWRKSIKLFGQVAEIVDFIGKTKNVGYLFATFTVRNVKAEGLKAAIKQLNDAFALMTQEKKNFPAADKLKKNLLGFFKGLEITYNTKDDTYHPHIHCIYEVRPSYFSGEDYINMNGWRDLWKAAAKMDYTPQVMVKAVRDLKTGDKISAGAVAEVAKYPIKIDSLLHIKDMDIAARAVGVLLDVSYHRRFTTFGGELAEVRKHLRQEDLEGGDLVHVETDQETKGNVVYQALFKYNYKLGVYIC